MKDKLYWKLNSLSLRYVRFAFFDTEDYLADRLFIRHKVRVRFDEEYASNRLPYRIIFCRVQKKDVPGFLAALEELKNSMLLCGHADYEKQVSLFMAEIENQRKGAAVS